MGPMAALSQASVVLCYFEGSVDASEMKKGEHYTKRILELQRKGCVVCMSGTEEPNDVGLQRNVAQEVFHELRSGAEKCGLARMCSRREWHR